MPLRSATVLVWISLALFAAPLAADVTIVATTSMSGMGQSGEGETVTKISGMKSRTETRLGREESITLLDLEARQMTVLEPDRKRAEVFDMAPLADQQAQIQAHEVEVEPTGTKRQVAGYSCEDHNLKARIEAGMASAPGMNVMVVMSGVVCLSPEAPGREESAAFYQAMAEKGLFLGNPEAAEAQPGREKGMTEMYRKMSEKGVALVSDIEIGFDGSGPMAAMLGRMKVSTKTTVTSISDAGLEAGEFIVPDGFRVKKK